MCSGVINDRSTVVDIFYEPLIVKDVNYSTASESGAREDSDYGRRELTYGIKRTAQGTWSIRS